MLASIEQYTSRAKIYGSGKKIYIIKSIVKLILHNSKASGATPSTRFPNDRDKSAENDVRRVSFLKTQALQATRVISKCGCGDERR